MKKLLICLAILGGCTDVPVVVFPQAPIELQSGCGDLSMIPDGTSKLSEVLPVVVSNYSAYHLCKQKVDNWNEWYKTQKDIFGDVK